MSTGYIENFSRYRDPVTGRLVTRLTGLQNSCHHPYFYCRAFTPDSRFLLYSSNRTASEGLYLLDLKTGESQLLVEKAGIDTFQCTLTPCGHFLYYSAGNTLYRLKLATLQTEEIYHQKPPYNGRGIYPGFSDDFQYVLLAQMHQEDVFPGKQGWDFFEPQCRMKPRCRLVLLNLRNGQEKVVLEEKCWLAHPQIRPGDSQTLMYCHEGPRHLIDARIWLIKADGTGKRPLGYVNTPDIVTHEYFTPCGRYVAYTHFPEVFGKQGSIRMWEIDTGREIDLGKVHNYSHPYHSPDSAFIVGDEVKKEDPSSACIWLFHVSSRREKALCLHGSSFASRGQSTQDAHPHPSFSPDGSLVVFTTDRETSPSGNCAVYLVSTENVF